MSGQKTVICVAGLASSALERLHKAQCCSPCRDPKARWSVSYCSIDALASNPLGTLNSLRMELVDGKLKDGTPVKSTRNCAKSGTLEVRPVQGTAGIRTLNPGEMIPVSVWEGLIDGNVEHLNMHAFNYDWRRWGDRVYAEEMVTMFQDKILSALKEDSHPSGKAAIVTHSMGAPVVLYCLGMLGDAWVSQNVDQVILVAPAMTGSPTMIPSLGHAPFVADLWMPKQMSKFITDSFGDLCATWACMVSELPMDIGGISPYPKDYVFATTPTKTYTYSTIGEFLEDLDKSSGNTRPFGKALWPGVQEMGKAMKCPPASVRTSLVYCLGADTATQFEYPTEDIWRAGLVKTSVPGDGTITGDSIKTVAEAWAKAGGNVHMLEVPGNISHKELIACDCVVGLLPKLCWNEALVVLEITIKNASVPSSKNTWCECQVPGKKETKIETEVAKDTNNPVWNFRSVMYGYHLGDALHFSVFDDSKVAEAKAELLRRQLSDIGHAVLEADSVTKGFEGTLPLIGGKGGSITLSVSVTEHEATKL